MWDPLSIIDWLLYYYDIFKMVEFLNLHDFVCINYLVFDCEGEHSLIPYLFIHLLRQYVFVDFHLLSVLCDPLPFILILKLSQIWSVRVYSCWFLCAFDFPHDSLSISSLSGPGCYRLISNYSPSSSLK